MTSEKIGSLPAKLAGLRIAVDGRYLRRPGIGIHNYLVGALRVLISEGADVTLLANAQPQGSSVSFDGAQCVEFGSSRNIIWEQIDLPKYLRRENFDCYWAPGNSGVPWRSIGSTRKISTTHDVVPLMLPRMYLVTRPGYAIPYFVWTFAALLRSDTLITVSESSAHDIRRVCRRSAHVVPSIFALPDFTAAPKELPVALVGRKYIVYNGGMDPRKNIAKLLEGFAIAHRRVPDLALVITGENYGLVQGQISELGIAEHVVLTGFVQDGIMRSILRSGQALVYPSLYEGFGMPLIEAFVADLPVITAANSALEEVAGDAAIFVDPRDPNSIANGILSMLKPGLGDEFRERGRRRLEDYDPVRVRRRFVEVIAEASGRLQ